jgi:V/A-type H+-transporting ATPase subunit C
MNAEPVLIDFYRYPPIGAEDWRYAFATARVRVLETLMPDRAMLADAANADGFESAAEILSGTDYAVGAKASLQEIEEMLLDRRRQARQQFADLMVDQEIVRLLRAREDFTNMRLAVRRVVTDKPLGLDYSREGNVPAEEFEEIFEQENYERFPDYLQEGVEAAVLAYYENKDIRQIDYAIDRVEALWRVRYCQQMKNQFGLSLFRIRIDLYNIRTLMRLKFAEREERFHFLPEGFVEPDRYVQGLDHSYDSLAPLFYATPYFELVEDGVRYFRDKQSFLALERGCEDYLMGFLKTTRSLAAGPQPVVAYFLMKEAEIRTIRMILTGKKNGLQPSLLMDRLGTWMG